MSSTEHAARFTSLLARERVEALLDAGSVEVRAGRPAVASLESLKA